MIMRRNGVQANGGLLSLAPYCPEPLRRYFKAMSLRCLIGAHRPSLVSILKAKGRGWVALCDGCGARLERTDEGRWSVSKPLASSNLLDGDA